MDESLEEFKQKVGKYSKDELFEISRNIDKEQYSDRHKLVVDKLNELNDKTAINFNNANAEIRYGGFWKRLWANVIDGFVCLLLIIPLLFLILINKYLVLLFPLLSLILIPLYSIYFNTKKGATPGKQYMGLIILKSNLTKISFRDACLRSSGDILFSFLQFIGLLISIKSVLHGIALNEGAFKLLNTITESSSSMYQFSSNLENIWFWSEVIVLLFNKKRRAIHDYIAGTVVVIEESLPIGVLSNIHAK